MRPTQTHRKLISLLLPWGDYHIGNKNISSSYYMKEQEASIELPERLTRVNLDYW